MWGICGGSGSGKTTLTRRLRARLGDDEVSVLNFDHYYRDLSHLTPDQRRVINYDHPDAFDHELFIGHLDQLSAGGGVEVPVYDFSTHTRDGSFEAVAAAPLVVVEGILLLAFPEVAARLDLTVFLDVPEPVRLRRRIRRDTSERGRDPDDVRRQFAATVAPMHDAYVQPCRDRADLIFGPEVDYEAVVDELLSRAPSRFSRASLRWGPEP